MWRVDETHPLLYLRGVYTKMKETGQNLNNAGNFVEPEIKTNVLYSAIPMPSNCNEILQRALEANSLFVFAYTSFLEKESLMVRTYNKINLLVPFIQTSLFRNFYHYPFLCCTCITANSSFKHLSDPQLALIFTRYKERVFTTDRSL